MMSQAPSLAQPAPLLRPHARPALRSPRKQVEEKQVRARFVPSVQEAEAIAALKARDPQALEHLVRDHCHWIYGAILRIVRNPDDAQSLVQETFFQAFKSLDAFRGHAKISTWIYGIAMNVTLSHLRKKTRQRQVLSEKEIDWLQPQFTWRGTHAERYPAWNPEARMEKQERVTMVRAAIDQLPDRLRVVLIMRDLEELSTEEVAEALSISEGNVRVRLHRARNALRKLLALDFRF